MHEDRRRPGSSSPGPRIRCRPSQRSPQAGSSALAAELPCPPPDCGAENGIRLVGKKSLTQPAGTPEIKPTRNWLALPCFSPTNTLTSTPDFYWKLGGGNGGDEPSYLIGFAGTDVQSVSLTVDGSSVPVNMRDSVAFAQYTNSAKTATIVVTCSNGSTKVGLARRAEPTLTTENP
jgi:hypothetical protein